MDFHSRSCEGRRLPFQRHLKSCLLMLLIMNTLLPKTLSSNVKRFPVGGREDCIEITNNSECQCQLSSNEYAIFCPKLENVIEKPKITIHIIPGIDGNLRIDCDHMNSSDYKILPEMQIGDIGTVQLRYCPLPGHTPISRLFNKLGLHGVSALFIEGNNLGTNLTRHHLSGLKNLKRFRLSSKDLAHIGDDLFEELENLIWLDFRPVNAKLPENIFMPLKNLNFLEITYSNLTHLHPGIFKNQQKLIGLNMWSNRLRDLNKYTFEGLSNLADLDLSANGIETLKPDVFELLTNLSNIHLSANRFRELPKGLFATTKNLSVFRLANNRETLRQLPPGLLSNLPVLNEVRLICGLEIISEDLFSNSSNIINISLNENRIKTLPESLFADQKSLTMLDLSSNSLTTLPEDIFRHNRNLKVLKLSKNKLQTITDSIFSSLISLEELHIDNNELSSITYNAFGTPRSLQKLYLQNNRLTLEQPIIGGETSSPFHSLNQLQVLNLSNNSVMYMFSDWRIMMTELRQLDLSYNKISQVSFEDLQYLSSYPLIVNLTNNQIESVNLIMWRLLSQRSQPLVLDLNDNPLRCDCILLYFVQFLRGDIMQKHSRNINVNVDRLSCVKPENLKGKAVREVPLTELLCPIDNEDSEEITCPSSCQCWARSYDLAMIINCTNGNRTEVPILPSALKLSLKSTELNMENNTLLRLPSSNSVGYSEVTRLMLAGNNLSKLEAESLPSALKFIDLSHNELSVLNNSVLNFFNVSRDLKVKLSANPWKCDCLARPFLQFSQTSYMKILDLDQIECIEPTNKKRFHDLSVNDICPTDKTLVIAIAVVIALFGFLIGLVAAVYYKYQKEIKIWLYAHNWCLWFVTEEELDKDKKYDAFISYSHKDEKFVAETLVPQLENGPIPFKVCVHFRDFLVGECIPNQIMRSVDESRRTIVVISQHFIESVWARLEFRAAHQAALTEKRARVIVIMYSDIGNPENLDTELQAYLKMNTYLKWGDPWFWDKLRYAMPHPSQKLNGLIKHHPKSYVDDKLELIKPSPITTPLTTPPAEATKNPLIAHLNGGTPQTAIMIGNGKARQPPAYFTNGKLQNGHINGAFIINTNAKQSDV